MRTVTIDYHLPQTVLLVTGVHRKTTDAGVTPALPVHDLVNFAISVQTEAEEEVREAQVRGGVLFSCKAKFGFTTDGRLTSASAESTGTVPAVISGVAGTAGAVLGAGFLGSSEEPHWKEFSADGEMQPIARRILDLEKALEALRAAQDRRLMNLVDHEDPVQAWPAIEAADRVLATLEDRRKTLTAVFDGWRASKVTTIDRPFRFTVPLDLIGTGLPTSPPVKSQDEPDLTSLDGLWERFGVTARARWLRTRPTQEAKVTAPTTAVITRIPDVLDLSVVEWRDGAPSEVSQARYAVADKRSTHTTFALERSLFGRRSLDLSFTTEGFLAGVGFERDAIAGAALDALGGLPSAIATGVEGSTKLRTGLAAAQRAQLDAELAHAKAQLDLQQTQISSAGLTLTSADAARLARLQQLKSLLESRTAVGGGDPDLAAWAKEQLDLLGY